MPFKSNEREFMSQVTSWLNEFLSSGTYPFENASSEPSLKGMDNKTQFPDVQLWLNRETQQGYGWELKTPATSAEDPALLENAVEKARTMSAAYFVTWNMRDAIIWKTPEAGNKVKADDSRRRYPSLYQISSPDDLLVQPNKIALKNRTKEILDDLATLHQRGSLHAIELDAIFFVHMLNNAVQALYPNVRDALVDKVGGDANFKKGLWDWAAKQGIANYADPAFYEVVSRQIVYRLLSRIIFYEALRRQWTNLPKMDIADSDVTVANNQIKEVFSKARYIDWHAVFEEDFSDKVGFPEPAIKTLDNLLRDLNNFNFSMMPQDVIGAVFEGLIPPDERHTLGQYFTPENLVDLIDTFCVRTRDALVLDPTCGTGTFLTRAYDRMKNNMGQPEHKKLLPQLWGIDIAHFPAQLATINLFRQDLHDYANFPRIVVSDTFKVRVGQSFSFPPPRINLDSGITTIDEKFPLFDAAVGNFPYIRQELINKLDPGYKVNLEETVKKDWLADYRDVFEISDKQYEEFKRSPDNIKYSKVGFKLSGQADIYAYLFFHVARFVKEGGRMGFVTSNSWLDVAYGYELQKFFLNNFKIVAVLESRAEPWFEDAAINTVVTILERCPDKTEVSNHTVKFVKIKRKLSELIPWDMKIEAAQRWHGLDGLVYKIESAGKANYKVENNTLINTLCGLQTYEDNDFRIRLVKQGELQDKLLKHGKTDKWGKYLRAPEVYFDILDKCASKLVMLGKVADIKRGFTTGINDFFYLSAEKIEYWGIEDEFLAPVLKSPRESESIAINPAKLELKVFLCSKSKEELLKENKNGALRYIEWGEKQKTDDGVQWPEIPTVSGRKYWYSLSSYKLTNLVWTKSYDTRFLQRYSETPLLADQRVYQIEPHKRINLKLLAAVLNSTFCSLFIESAGRINLGEGALDTTVEEAQEYVEIPDLKLFSTKSKTAIILAFNNLSKRKIGTINQESRLKDRQKLDSLILEALGLDPEKYLQPLYDGLTELVRERIELAGMRKKGKQAKAQRSIDKVIQEVIKEVLPNGLKKFPDEFLDAPLKPEEFENISIPKEPLSLGSLFLGTQEILTGSGSIYTARNSHAAKYIIYSQKTDTFTVSLPKDDIVVAKAMSSYELYLRKIKEELYKDFSRHTLDPGLSERLAQQALKELGLPDFVLSL